jgi:hypothetical protein
VNAFGAFMLWIYTSTITRARHSSKLRDAFQDFVQETDHGLQLVSRAFQR